MKLFLTRHNKAATTTEYALLISLIGAVALGGVLLTGNSIRDIFGQADITLNQNLEPEEEEQISGTTITGPEGTAFDLASCYQDTAGPSTLSFGDSDGYDCFLLEAGPNSFSAPLSFDAYVRGSTGSDTITTGDGHDLIELMGEPADYALTTVDAGNGNNLVTMSQGQMPSITTGTGNDTISITATDNSTGGQGIRFVTHTAGPGDNTIDYTCTDDLASNVPNVSLNTFIVAGQDTITQTGCYISYTVESSTAGTPTALQAKSFDLTMVGDNNNFGDLNFKNGIWNGIDITGAPHSLFGITLPTDATRMFGDYNINVQPHGGPGTHSGNVPVSIHIQNTDGTIAQATGNTVDVRIDSNKFWQASGPVQLDGQIMMYDPQDWATMEIVGEELATRDSDLYMRLEYVSDPTTTTYTMPTLIGEGMNLRLGFGTQNSYSGYTPTTCWTATLIDTTGGAADLPVGCGQRGFTNPSYTTSPAGGSWTTASLGTYNRLEVTDEAGNTHQFNFNGAPGKNGNTLTIRRLLIDLRS